MDTTYPEDEVDDFTPPNMVEQPQDESVYQKCCWEWEMSSWKKKVLWALIYTLTALSFVALILSGIHRFNKNQSAGTMLFVVNLLFIVPGNVALCYLIIFKKWMITP